MAAIYHPGVVQIVPHHNIGSGRDALNVLYFQTPAVGLTPAQLTAMQTAFDTAWATNWKIMAAATTAYNGSVVTDMSSNTGAQQTNSAYTPVAGTATGSEVSDNTCCLISLRTATRYRGGHGRIYLAGTASSRVNTDGRTVTAAQIIAMNQLFDNVATAMQGISGSAGGPLNWIVWHKHWTANPNSVELVFGRVSQPVLATQRRRLRKVSRHKRA